VLARCGAVQQRAWQWKRSIGDPAGEKEMGGGRISSARHQHFYKRCFSA